MEWVKESYYVRTLCLYCLPLAVAIGTVKALAMYLGVFLSMHDGLINYKYILMVENVGFHFSS